MAFTYDPATNTYRSSAEQTLELFRTENIYDRHGVMRQTRYRTPACATCPFAQACCKNTKKGRRVTRNEFERAKERMIERMKDEANNERYQL